MVTGLLRKVNLQNVYDLIYGILISVLQTYPLVNNVSYWKILESQTLLYTLRSFNYLRAGIFIYADI